MKVGIDIVEIGQVNKIKNLEKFLSKFYAVEELKYIQTKVKKDQTIAGMYAAKEAFLKALEIGIGKIPLKEVVVGHKENNSPYIVMNKAITDLLHEYGFNHADISISHGGDYSVSICQLS